VRPLRTFRAGRWRAEAPVWGKRLRARLRSRLHLAPQSTRTRPRGAYVPPRGAGHPRIGRDGTVHASYCRRENGQLRHHDRRCRGHVIRDRSTIERQRARVGRARLFFLPGLSTGRSRARSVDDDDAEPAAPATSTATARQCAAFLSGARARTYDCRGGAEQEAMARPWASERDGRTATQISRCFCVSRTSRSARRRPKYAPASTIPGFGAAGSCCSRRRSWVKKAYANWEALQGVQGPEGGGMTSGLMPTSGRRSSYPRSARVPPIFFFFFFLFFSGQETPATSRNGPATRLRPSLLQQGASPTPRDHLGDSDFSPAGPRSLRRKKRQDGIAVGGQERGTSALLIAPATVSILYDDLVPQRAGPRAAGRSGPPPRSPAGTRRRPGRAPVARGLAPPGDPAGNGRRTRPRRRQRSRRRRRSTLFAADDRRDVRRARDIDPDLWGSVGQAERSKAPQADVQRVLFYGFPLVPTDSARRRRKAPLRASCYRARRTSGRPTVILPAAATPPGGQRRIPSWRAGPAGGPRRSRRALN